MTRQILFAQDIYHILYLNLSVKTVELQIYVVHHSLPRIWVCVNKLIQLFTIRFLLFTTTIHRRSRLFISLVVVTSVFGIIIGGFGSAEETSTMPPAKTNIAHSLISHTNIIHHNISFSAAEETREYHRVWSSNTRLSPSWRIVEIPSHLVDIFQIFE